MGKHHPEELKIDAVRDYLSGTRLIEVVRKYDIAKEIITPMESFFSLFKNEELKLHRGKTMKEMKAVIDEFIYYYNYERPQYGLKKLTPFEYRSQL